MKKKIVWISLAIFFLVILIIGGITYHKFYSPFFNIKETVYVYIDDRKDYQDLLMQLETVAKAKNIALFEQFSKAAKYPGNMKTGRYAVKPDMSCKIFLQQLRNGNQTPSNITFNNIRLKKEFADRLGEQMMFSAEELLSQLNDSAVCASCGFTPETILCMFIPNTYQFYWNMPVDGFLKRMKKEYDRFWTPERMAKAQQIPLTPVQVSILASIVEEETAVRSEYSIVSGLYINRLKRGMLLQADPTVKFAVGDFSLQRILNVHLATDSPYNTYQHGGLPPGPIRMPSIAGLDAVLNYQEHNYIFMCAKEDFSGTHNFATTSAEHGRNATKWRAALNQRGIR